MWVVYQGQVINLDVMETFYIADDDQSSLILKPSHSEGHFRWTLPSKEITEKEFNNIIMKKRGNTKVYFLLETEIDSRSGE